MFRPAKIFHTKNFVPKEKAKELILALHEKGICELKQTTEDGEKLSLSKEETLSLKEVHEVSLKLGNLITSVEPFREIVAPENAVKQMFFPKEPKKNKVDLLSNEKIFSQVKNKLEEIEPLVTKKLDTLGEIRTEMQKNNVLMENLLLLPKKTNTNVFESTQNISVSAGLVSNASIQKLKEKIGLKAFITLEQLDEKNSVAIVTCYAPEQVETEKILHETGFEKIIFPFEKKSPQEIYNDTRQKNIELGKKEAQTKNSLYEIVKKHEDDLESLKEELEIAKERIQAHDLLCAGDSFAVLEAWVPATQMKHFERILKEKCSAHYTEIIERDDAPTIYNNNRFISPFEIITNLYSVPKYRGFDPTPLIAVSFALFFGYMLTDFVYGILTTGLAFMIYRGIGRYNQNMKKFSAMLIMLGISTAVLGIIFKSYLGNFVPDILTANGIEIPGIDPIKQVFLAIIIALGIGAIHLFVGLVSGYIENTKKGNIKKAIGEQGVWIFFLVGGVIAMIGGERFSFFGLALIGLAVIVQLAYNYLENGLVIAVLSIFNFSGFLGDLFSYARLTALAVGTAGIALAVNFMAYLAIGMIPFLGLPIAIAVFVVGHLFNMVMNGLGAFIHALRLHFLEFFSKFYEGGGKLYKPFYAFRKKNSTEVK